MSSSPAMDYLAEYKKLAEPQLFSLIENKKQLAAQMDSRAATLVAHFLEVARGGHMKWQAKELIQAA